jgi:hypothetical protein
MIDSDCYLAGPLREINSFGYAIDEVLLNS